MAENIGRLLRLKNWQISGIFAIIDFLIVMVIEILLKTDQMMILVKSSTTGMVFFIWCWFILSLWRKDK